MCRPPGPETCGQMRGSGRSRQISVERLLEERAIGCNRLSSAGYLLLTILTGPTASPLLCDFASCVLETTEEISSFVPSIGADFTAPPCVLRNGRLKTTSRIKVRARYPSFASAATMCWTVQL